MKKTPIRKKGNSPISKAKDRIQKLLTAIVRIRDGGCIFRKYNVGKCGGYTAADHIKSRIYSKTYGDLRNVICACSSHHIFWKRSHPTEYTEIVKKHIGIKTYNLIEKLSKIETQYTLKEWLKIEDKLKKCQKKKEQSIRF